MRKFSVLKPVSSLLQLSKLAVELLVQSLAQMSFDRTSWCLSRQSSCTTTFLGPAYHDDRDSKVSRWHLKTEPEWITKRGTKWAELVTGGGGKLEGPWSSGYGRRLMFVRSWVWIPAPYTGYSWHFSHCIVCLLEKTENKQKEAGFGPFFLKKKQKGFKFVCNGSFPASFYLLFSFFFQYSWQ